MLQKEKRVLDPLSCAELKEKDEKYLWHHMTPYNSKVRPTIFAEGKGVWLTDIDGERYLDGMSGLWCVNVGYHQPALAEAAANQLNTLPFYTLLQGHVPAVQLAEKLNEWLDDEYMIFFSNSGSDANEVAFKVARQYYKQIGEGERYKFISRYRAYHGNSMGALSATGQADRKIKYEPLVEGFKHVPAPDCYRCPFGQTYGECKLECVQAIDQAIQLEGEQSVAGVIMEPTITGGGVIVPPPEYLKQVEELCQRRGILLIIDEVICGFGRSGERFGHQNYGVKPDMITMAKGITSGYLPLSATAIRKNIYEAFKQEGEHSYFRHLNTFGGSPAACAIALANLELIEQENLVPRAKEFGKLLEEKLLPLKDHPAVGDIRHFGFLAGIELVEDKEKKEPIAPEKINQVITYCKQNGVLIGKNGGTSPGLANILTICPPFVITEEELELLVSTIKAGIATLA